MTDTLYSQAKSIEGMHRCLEDLSSPNQIDVHGLQRTLFQKYEGNPVLDDAIQRRQSVEESLEELGQVKRGIKKFIPWRKDEGHNRRLKQLGELISEPEQLHKYGVFMPDNLVTVGIAVTLISFGAGYSIGWTLPPIEISPQRMYSLHVTLPTMMSLVLVPLIGLTNNRHRFGSLPIGEAKYLDEKVQEFYK